MHLRAEPAPLMPVFLRAALVPIDSGICQHHLCRRCRRCRRCHLCRTCPASSTRSNHRLCPDSPKSNLDELSELHQQLRSLPQTPPDLVAGAGVRFATATSRSAADAATTSHPACALSRKGVAHAECGKKQALATTTVCADRRPTSWAEGRLRSNARVCTRSLWYNAQFGRMLAEETNRRTYRIADLFLRHVFAQACRSSSPSLQRTGRESRGHSHGKRYVSLHHLSCLH